MAVRYLPDHLINQIAAGEVVERPAAALKELIENAIDAGADHIDIDIENGGKTLLRIRDNGCGMNKDDLSAAVDRHATSKLPDDNLENIHSFGFRGEALPSIASVSHLAIQTRSQDDDHGWKITIDHGMKGSLQPSAIDKGTIIEMRDIFKLTPARLKFMKTDRSEFTAIRDIVMRQAMANHGVTFKLSHNNKASLSIHVPLNVEGRENFIRQRSAQLLGNDFVNNAIYIDHERDGIHLYGLISLPTYHKATAQSQYFFVNSRAVRDKLLHGVTRAAYTDVLPHDRHCVVVLYIDVPSDEVDVNVHPTKAEVRFRDSQKIRNIIISTLRHSIHDQGQKTSTHITDKLSERLAGHVANNMAENGANHIAYQSQMQYHAPSAPGHEKSEQNQQSEQSWQFGQSTIPAQHAGYATMHDRRYPSYQPLFTPEPSALPSDQSAQDYNRDYDQGNNNQSSEMPPPQASAQDNLTDIAYPLGAARAQLHANYIISQTSDGLVIVDQHAAHERLVYERLKDQMAQSTIPSQAFLTPEIIDLPQDEADALIENRDELAKFGMDINAFGPNAVALSAYPSILQGKINWERLVQDLAATYLDNTDRNLLQEKIYERLSSAACHGSIRSGRAMNIHEMNALLRQMEQTPLSGQCNHGRPTYITLKLTDIESLFGRK